MVSGGGGGGVGVVGGKGGSVGVGVGMSVKNQSQSHSSLKRSLLHDGGHRLIISSLPDVLPMAETIPRHHPSPVSLPSIPSLEPGLASRSTRLPSGPLHAHPLAQSPITAVPSATASPLPLRPLLPPKVAHLRHALARRRSSYPPVSTSNSAPFVFGGTPESQPSVRLEDLDPDIFSGFGKELSGAGSGLTPLGFEGLLSFGTEDSHDPAANPLFRAGVLSMPPFSEASTSRAGMAHAQAVHSPGRIAQFGSDLVWRTILASVVEVDGVGPVGVARLMQEVWKRGGGDAVSQLGLWGSVIMALSLYNEQGAVRVAVAPSHEAAQALESLYNLTVRHWEPAIFTGLLVQHTGHNITATPVRGLDGAESVYGASTPTKQLNESDMSQWMNLTPGALDLSSLLGSTPKMDQSLAQFPAFDFLSAFAPQADDRRPSTAKSEANGQEIGDLIAAIEDQNRHARDSPPRILDLTRPPSPPRRASSEQPDLIARRSPSLTGGKGKGRADSLYQLPTPETDNSDSPAQPSIPLQTSSQSLPPTRKNSAPLSPQRVPPTPISRAQSLSKAGMQLKLPMPTDAFVPPPPMCMFFNPSFKDLQVGKVGVWQGDLVIRGRDGGKFGIMIIGETDTGSLWESEGWPKTITYPSESSSTVECSTSSMIPVSHLAREGFTPAAQGMVLCKDEDVTPFVRFVQGLHSEGVAFHLATPSGQPIIFLPAKFDSTDVLQRLGIAFMTKADRNGRPIRPTPANNVSSTSSGSSEEQPKKKRRRQSAPAKASSLSMHRKRPSVALGGGRIDEEAVDDTG